MHTDTDRQYAVKPYILYFTNTTLSRGGICLMSHVLLTIATQPQPRLAAARLIFPAPGTARLTITGCSHLPYAPSTWRLSAQVTHSIGIRGTYPFTVPRTAYGCASSELFCSRLLLGPPHPDPDPDPNLNPSPNPNPGAVSGKSTAMCEVSTRRTQLRGVR